MLPTRLKPLGFDSWEKETWESYCSRMALLEDEALRHFYRQKEDVEHHVEEEENEMFPMIRKQIDEKALETLGAQMEDEKQKFIKSSGKAAGR